MMNDTPQLPGRSSETVQTNKQQRCWSARVESIDSSYLNMFVDVGETGDMRKATYVNNDKQSVVSCSYL